MSAPPFLFVGSHLVLDFVNTEIVSDGARRDLIVHDEDLARFARAAGVRVAAAAGFPAQRRDPRIASLRATVRALIEAAIDGRAPARAEFAALDAFLALALPPPGLAFQRGRFARQTSAFDGVAPLLGHLASEAAALLATVDPARLRRCEGAGCVLLFLDTSKSGARRWCSMAVCGNRAKVAAHYHRGRRGREAS